MIFLYRISVRIYCQRSEIIKMLTYVLIVHLASVRHQSRIIIDVVVVVIIIITVLLFVKKSKY